jgi:hypothetical protein
VGSAFDRRSGSDLERDIVDADVRAASRAYVTVRARAL